MYAVLLHTFPWVLLMTFELLGMTFLSLSDRTIGYTLKLSSNSFLIFFLGGGGEYEILGSMLLTVMIIEKQ